MAASPIHEIVRDCLAVRMRLIARAVTSVYDHAIAGHGLSIAQLNLLAAVGTIGPCAPSRLGDLLNLERSTVSRNLNLLLSHGWVAPAATDAKGVREVALTPAGRRKVASVMPDWRKAQEQAAELLGAGGVRTVRSVAHDLSELPAD